MRFNKLKMLKIFLMGVKAICISHVLMSLNKKRKEIHLFLIISAQHELKWEVCSLQHTTRQQFDSVTISIIKYTTVLRA